MHNNRRCRQPGEIGGPVSIGILDKVNMETAKAPVGKTCRFDVESGEGQAPF